jgi:hypothetical protein
LIDSSTKLELENNLRDSESEVSDADTKNDKNAVAEIPKVKDTCP